MELQNKILNGGEKIAIFDSDAYITIANKGIDIEKILLKEKEKTIKAYAHFWILAELLQCGDIKTLEIVNKHCSENSGLLRLFADPASQVYLTLYAEESPYTEKSKQEMICLIDKVLNGKLEQKEKAHIKSQLENSGIAFVKGFENYKGGVGLNSNTIQEHVICQIIQVARKLRGDSTLITGGEINVIAKGFPAAGMVYQDLMKRKLQQNNNGINKTDLLHDQRDWQLFFYGGKDDIYIVTQETKIKKLNLKNIISLEDYCQKILQI